MPSFSLLEAGRGKARYVSSRGRFGMSVLASNWRFWCSHASQPWEAVVAPRGIAAQATRESSRSDFGALKSTGRGRRVPRSASQARAPCCELQSAAAADLGRYSPGSAFIPDHL
eukprot:COSAG02_NODE_5087_length_4644_cov_7.739714_1_plen_114_part_00